MTAVIVTWGLPYKVRHPHHTPPMTMVFVGKIG